MAELIEVIFSTPSPIPVVLAASLQGPPGPPGADGYQGADGADGADGSLEAGVIIDGGNF